MFIILIATIYDPPEKDGYCYIITIKWEHEFCKCDGVNGGSEGEICKSYCNGDADCKGYDFGLTQSYCRMFTTAPCPIGCNNHPKYNVGFVGSLVIYPYPGIRCFIKRLGKHI